MAGVLLDVSMSVDGYMVGPNADRDRPLGENGERLFDWLHDGFGDADREVLDELMRSIGAVVMGRRSFDDFEDAGEDVDWPADVPVFVLTRRPPEEVPRSRSFTFVTGGLEEAVRLAGDAAGDRFMASHGAAVSQEFLRAGLVDEIQLHLAPMVLGGGVRLFDGVGRLDLQQTRSIQAAAATHVRFRVLR